MKINNAAKAARMVINYLKKEGKINITGLKLPAAIKLFAESKNLIIIGEPKVWIRQYYNSLTKDKKTKSAKKEIVCIKEEPKAVLKPDPLFYQSNNWIILRQEVFAKYGRSCMCCGETYRIMHVDHIKPRRDYPQLELDFYNLQVLCPYHNKKKGNLNTIDYRPTLIEPKAHKPDIVDNTNWTDWQYKQYLTNIGKDCFI